MGTKDDIDVLWLRLREEVDYKKALDDVFDLEWTQPDEDVVSMELVNSISR